MRKQKSKGMGSASVVEAAALPAHGERDYPPPPGYKFVYHVTKEPGEEMALFLANMDAVRACCRAGLEYLAEHNEDTTNPRTSATATLPNHAQPR